MPYLKKETLCPEPIDCKILTAALSLFVANGYHRVSIHDIQELSAVSIGSIYNHFGGKEGVAKALYAHLIKELNELVEDTITNNLAPSDQCVDIINQIFNFTQTHSDIISFLFHTKHSDFILGQTSIFESVPFIKINQVITEAIQLNEFKPLNSKIIVAGIFGGAIHLVQRYLDGDIDLPTNKDALSLVTAFSFHS